MRRSLLLTGLIFVALLAIAVLSAPWWLGTALRVAGESRGLKFEQYERDGYGRFVVRGVTYSSGAATITATSVEAPTPVVWLWQVWRNREPHVSVAQWTVSVERREPAATPAPAKKGGWVPFHDTLRNVSGLLDTWLANAELGPGTVRWTNGELSLQGATWADRELRVEKLAFKGTVADLQVNFPADANVVRLAVEAGAMAAGATIESRRESVSGEIVIEQQRAPVRLRFGETGWLPVDGELTLADWTLPAERLKLGEVYASVAADGQARWDGERFLVNLAAAAAPKNEANAPALKVDVRAEGLPERITVAALNVVGPGVTATLTNPIVVGRDRRLEGEGGRFDVEMQLAEQPWFEGTGVVRGTVHVPPGEGAAPQLDFTLAADAITARGVALRSARMEGGLVWPQLTVGKATIVGGSGETLEASGGWDFQKKEVLPARIAGTLRRESIARWLPAQPQFEEIELNAFAEGPLASVRHRGSAKADAIQIRGVRPLAVALEWSGNGADVAQFSAESRAGETRVRLGGAVDRSRLELRELTFSRSAKSLLELQRPAIVRWKPGVEVDGLHLAGPEGKVDVGLVWNTSGSIEAAASRLPSTWLSDLIELKGPAWQVELLALKGAWKKGPMEFAVTVGASVDLGEGRRATVNFAGRGDRTGVVVEALRAAEGGETVFNATARLPATFHPGAQELVRLDPQGALQLDASAAPHSAFWPKIAAATGVELRDPTATLHAEGTWERPEGSLELRARRIAIDPKRLKREVPGLEDLNVRLGATKSEIVLGRFEVKVEGEPVLAQGRLAIPDGGWPRLAKQPLAGLQRDADATVRIPRAQISAFKRFLPAALAPQGIVTAEISYRDGALAGGVRLENAASRPLGPLGVLQEINAEIELAGRALKLSRVTAKSGGQPITLTGAIELPEKSAPRFDVGLRGENLPFVRQTGLLVRGDLDLKLVSAAKEGVATITGQVRLRDSLFLQDVRAFLPRGGASGGKQPPYFSVDAAPFNQWQLAVEVVGDEFMRLRTPVFNGLASAHFRLTGTLGEPRAFGEVTIEEGAIRMPFASFAVQQGSVRLTEANPFDYTVYVRGTGRRFGYDLTMEIEGLASSPNVEFTSSPALESDQVLLMVMTGAAPQNEIAYSGTQRAAKIGAYLGQSLLGSLGSNSGNPERLSISSGEKISRQGRETYDIEYKLSERWTATGEYNEYDEYNAGLKWRIFPKPEPTDAKRDPAKREEEKDASARERD